MIAQGYLNQIQKQEDHEDTLTHFKDTQTQNILLLYATLTAI